jgi:hypothetical protein
MTPFLQCTVPGNGVSSLLAPVGVDGYGKIYNPFLQCTAPGNGVSSLVAPVGVDG